MCYDDGDVAGIELNIDKMNVHSNTALKQRSSVAVALPPSGRE